MEGLNQVFPIPIYMNKLELGDIEIPNFENTNVIRQEIPELKDKVLEIVSDMISEIGYAKQPLKLNDMWFNCYNESRPFLEYHFHQNCAWTGTYYPEDTNHLTALYNPNANLVQAHYPESKTPSPFNEESVMFHKVEKGGLIIHPSWIAHQVAWTGGEPSHSISFDIAYQLPIGSKDFGSYSE